MDSLMAFSGLFFGHEHVNIVAEHVEGQPVGAGQTMPRDKWMRYFRAHGVPSCPAGAWFRFNPVTERGSGRGGAVCDSDVTAFRFLLIESDKLPMELQLSFLGKLRLPVAALISSGGKSAHCLIRMDCTDADEYRAQAGRIPVHLEIVRFPKEVKHHADHVQQEGISMGLACVKNGKNPCPSDVGHKLFVSLRVSY